MTAPTTILDLPVELLLQIFSYLPVSSFLNLTSTCRALHNPELVCDAAYWSTLARSTFRVPNQPVIEKDGLRWARLYKRMLTQSRVYTWGNNEKACLGHSWESHADRQAIRAPGLRGHDMRRRQRVSWPEPMSRVGDLGVIADLQCGGWSTTLLTAKGALYTVGVIDGLQFNRQRPPYVQKVMTEPLPLRYPPGFPHPYDRYEASTAVKQFSSGRAHILALSDSGRIWSWQNIEHPAYHVKFLQHDTVENGKSIGKGVVKKVVAGWNKSTALVEGTGIVVWEPLARNAGTGEEEVEDTMLMIETALVPLTSFREKDSRATDGREAEIGEVRNYIVLEELLIFCTHLGKAFVCDILWNERRIGEPVEIPLLFFDEQPFITDVQGSFRTFGIFTRSGAVLTSTQDRIRSILQGDGAGDQSALFTRIPALQHRDVIQLAFGDYHFHALHATGHISSYGTELQNCGALGLGGPGAEGCLRGMRYSHGGGDGRLVPHAYAEGRRVWFERPKRAWIKFLTSGGVDPEEAMERLRMAIGTPDIRCQGEVSEWVEQQGWDWESKFEVRNEDDDGLGAYFAMGVTAAGWHSGALVLVNEELSEKLKRAVEIPDADAAPKPAEGDGESSTTTHGAQSSYSLLSWVFATGADYLRWFLGIAPYSAHATAVVPPTDAPEPGSTPNMDDYNRGLHPINYGAKPRVGVSYVWAQDAFPRLVLSDGTEMPGNVPFDKWRYDRPVWDERFTL